MGKSNQKKQVHHKYHPVHSSSKENLRATQWASLMYQAMTYLSLCRVFNFTSDDLQKLQDEMNRISERIMDPDDKYDVMSVLDQLEEHDIQMDRKDFIKIFLGE